MASPGPSDQNLPRSGLTGDSVSPLSTFPSIDRLVSRQSDLPVTLEAWYQLTSRHLADTQAPIGYLWHGRIFRLPGFPRSRQLRDSHSLPGRAAMELVAHKWTIHIMFALHEADGPARFRALQRRVAPITQKELTKRLRALEQSGLVSRRVFAEVPPRVEYRLTELGQTLIPVLTALHDWAERNGPTLDEHRNTAAQHPGE